MKTSTSLSVQYDNIFSPFPGRQWADGLRWVKDAGFDAVEIILSDPDLIDRRLLQKQLEQLLKRQEELAARIGKQEEKLSRTCRELDEELSSQLYTFNQMRDIYEK